MNNKPIVVVGLYTIRKLLNGQDVDLKEVTLIPDSQLFNEKNTLKEEPMKTNHTPGLWKALPGTYSHQTELKVVGDDKRGTRNYQFYAMVGGDFEKREANARLIATAPELLEVLKSSSKYLEKLKNMDRLHADGIMCLDKSNAAIVKAEGRDK